MRQAPLLSTHADANSHEIPHERKWSRMISSHAKEDLRVHPVHDAKKALSCLWKTVALSTCLPETFSRQHRPLFHLCHLVMSWERLSRVVFCLNIVQLHYFLLLFFSLALALFHIFLMLNLFWYFMAMTTLYLNPFSTAPCTMLFLCLKITLFTP